MTADFSNFTASNTETVQEIKDFIFSLIHRLPGGRVCTQKYLLSKNFLSRSGWKRSVDARMPMDEHGNPIPWFTYSSIHFLKERLHPGLRVFEYGCGNSTLWLAERSDKVVSLEHDTLWFERMRPLFRQDSRIELIHRPLEGGVYAEEIKHYPGAFDLVIIDGRDRVRCALNAVAALRKDGVLIWDDTQREEYQKGCDQLVEQGFRRLDFYGTGPISPHASCTSIFYRAENCLGI